MSKQQKQAPRPTARLTKDLSEFFDKELNRLYDVLKTSDVSPETRSWAMESIKGIQTTVLTIATAVSTEVNSAVESAGSSVAEVGTNGSSAAAADVVRSIVSNS